MMKAKNAIRSLIFQRNSFFIDNRDFLIKLDCFRSILEYLIQKTDKKLCFIKSHFFIFLEFSITEFCRNQSYDAYYSVLNRKQSEIPSENRYKIIEILNYLLKFAKMRPSALAPLSVKLTPCTDSSSSNAHRLRLTRLAQARFPTQGAGCLNMVKYVFFFHTMSHYFET